MLAQLLGKHGLPAQRLGGVRSSRAALAALEPEGIALVCISALATNGSLARLRLLVRRLRRRLPHAQILIGLWPRNGATNTEDVVVEIGADRCVVSLAQAVRVCLEAVRSAPDSSEHKIARAEREEEETTVRPLRSAASGAGR